MIISIVPVFMEVYGRTKGAGRLYYGQSRVERDFGKDGEVDVSYVCHFVEVEFVLSAAFELVKLPYSSGGSDSFEALLKELTSVMGVGGPCEVPLLKALENAYREDLFLDLKEFGVAWIEELRHCFDNLRDVSERNPVLLLVGCPKVQDVLVKRLWGAKGYIEIKSNEVGAILNLLRKGISDAILLRDAHNLDLMLFRQLCDRSAGVSPRSCHMIGLIPDSIAFEKWNYDPGTFSRFHPISLSKLEMYEQCIDNGTPTTEECERLLKSVRDGLYVHYNDLLLLAVLNASRIIAG